MDDVVFNVWLQISMGEGSRKSPMLLEYFGSCRAVYESSEREKYLSGLLAQEEIDRMAATPLESAEEILESCRRLQYDIITPESEKYPTRLANLSDYPLALYVNGEFPDIDNEVCIAMVGTRRASKYGYNVASSIAKDLAASGAIVISGCARGIDTAAHQGAIIGGGKTLAVLGCGINTRYNLENEGLRKIISSNGAVISEYPPGSPPLGYHFPVRNRIISALSLGVVVVEAGAKSGSLITANLAMQQGKDIFSVPGEITSTQCKGSNRLIMDGAKPVESASDVLEEYITRFPQNITMKNAHDKNARVFDKTVRPKWEVRKSFNSKGTAADDAKPDKSNQEVKPEAHASSASRTREAYGRKDAPSAEQTKAQEKSDYEEPPVGMSENSVKILNRLGSTPKLLQDLMDELSMSASVILQSITELELYGVVDTLPGKRYKRR